MAGSSISATLSELPPPLQVMAQAALPVSAPTQESPSERLDRLEVATRTHLLSVTQRLVAAVRVRSRSRLLMGCQTSTDVDGDEENIMIDMLRFLKASLDLCYFIAKHVEALDTPEGITACSAAFAAATEGMGPAARLPFLLLEDAIDTLPLSKCKILWVEGIEAWSEILCDPVLFAPGKLIFLRLCNKLLTKKLSREQNAEFSGRILMFMASAYPLSERSGLNILGKFNVDNITEYEDETMFDQTMQAQTGQAMRSRDGDDMKVDVSSAHPAMVNYTLYRTLWDMQKHLSNPQLILQNESTWSQFVGNAKSILSAFECNPFPQENLIQARERWNASKKLGIDNSQDEDEVNLDDVAEQIGPRKHSSDETGDLEQAARHQKYLTNSQLLRLQIRDPEFRSQFLAQFFIACNFVLSGAGGPAKEKGTLVETLQKRVRDLLQLTPPNGKEQIGTLEWLVGEREPLWMRWKVEKCQSFEKYKDDTNSSLLARRSGSSHKWTNALKRGRKKSTYVQIDAETEVPVISQNLARAVPQMDSFLLDYADALDPESGIDEEYHPKNDVVFCWRSIRVLSKDHLDRFSQMSVGSGDFAALIRSVWKDEKGIVIPEASPKSAGTISDPINVESEGSSMDDAGKLAYEGTKYSVAEKQIAVNENTSVNIEDGQRIHSNETQGQTYENGERREQNLKSGDGDAFMTELQIQPVGSAPTPDEVDKNMDDSRDRVGPGQLSLSEPVMHAAEASMSQNYRFSHEEVAKQGNGRVSPGIPVVSAKNPFEEKFLSKGVGETQSSNEVGGSRKRERDDSSGEILIQERGYKRVPEHYKSKEKARDNDDGQKLDYERERNRSRERDVRDHGLASPERDDVLSRRRGGYHRGRSGRRR